MKERLKNLYQNKELAPQRLLSAVAKGWLTVMTTQATMVWRNLTKSTFADARVWKY